jgi:hypothetical protein
MTSLCRMLGPFAANLRRLAPAFVLLAVTGCGGRESGTSTASSCNDNGNVHANGASWPCSDGCNTCSCSNGRMASTMVACLGPPMRTVWQMPYLRTAQWKQTHRTQPPKAVRALFEPPITTNPANRIRIASKWSRVIFAARAPALVPTERFASAPRVRTTWSSRSSCPRALSSATAQPILVRAVTAACAVDASRHRATASA